MSRKLPVDVAVLRRHLSKAFRQQVPPAKFNQVLEQLVPPGGLRVTKVTSVSPSQLRARVTTTQSELELLLTTGAHDVITGLVFRPPSEGGSAPTSWTALDLRLTKVAPGIGMLTAEVSSDGRCHPLHAVAADTARPLGSLFKLYVLGAVAHQVESGRLHWDDELTITSALKSLPSGELQDRKDGSTVSVRQAALKMISISDNTAADLLAHEVGRARVEAAVRRLGSRHAARNVPFLRTRELFALKGHDYPTLARTYLAKTPTQRLDHLTTTVDRVPRSEVTMWAEPRDINRIEWFASPADICRAFAGLNQLTSKPGLGPVAKALSANDGGLDLDEKAWPSVWFKGGSEPGVLTLGWRAKTSDGHTFVSVLMAESPDAALEDTSAVPELLALAKGSLALARR